MTCTVSRYTLLFWIVRFPGEALAGNVIVQQLGGGIVVVVLTEVVVLGTVVVVDTVVVVVDAVDVVDTVDVVVF